MGTATGPEVHYSTVKVAETFGVTTETVRNWITRGVIKGVKVGSHWRVPRSEVLRLANEKYGPVAG